MVQQVDALFFDLDGTLLNEEASYRAAVDRVCSELLAVDARLEVDKLARAYLELANRYWNSVGWDVPIDLHAIREDMWRHALAALGQVDVAEAAEALYTRERRSTVIAFPDAEKVLSSLHGRIPLALITNGDSETQWGKLRTTAFERYFDAVLVSGDIGVGKPDPAIFRLTLERLNLRPDLVWHVGDSLHHDIFGAKSAGLGAVWLNRGHALRGDSAPQPDHEIASLAELIDCWTSSWRAERTASHHQVQPEEERLTRCTASQTAYELKRTLATLSVTSKRGAG